jgi:hypothetical protein
VSHAALIKDSSETVSPERKGSEQECMEGTYNGELPHSWQSNEFFNRPWCATAQSVGVPGVGSEYSAETLGDSDNRTVILARVESTVWLF